MRSKACSISETPEKAKPQVFNESLEKERSFFIEGNGLLSFYPYYFENSLSQKLQKFYSQNGHLLLIKTLQIEIFTDLNACRRLWEKFTPNQNLFDTWEFRLAFWRGYRYPPYFLLLKTETEGLALLPLWYEGKKKKYFWFGSWWQEENSFFIKDPIFVPILLNLCPPVHLNAISLGTVLWAQEYVKFKPDDPKYVLDLRGVNSVDDYLARFRKKRRYNFKRDRRIIEAQNPQIIFDNFSDFKIMIELCKKRFAEKGEDTDWDDPGRVETFRQVINLGRQNKSYQVRMITVRIGDRVAGVDLIGLFNGCYYPLKCGYDVKNFPGIGNYVNLLEIQDALNLGMKKMDFLEIGYGWKDKWFEEIPLFKYDKK